MQIDASSKVENIPTKDAFDLLRLPIGVVGDLNLTCQIFSMRWASAFHAGVDTQSSAVIRQIIESWPIDQTAASLQTLTRESINTRFGYKFALSARMEVDEKLDYLWKQGQSELSEALIRQIIIDQSVKSLHHKKRDESKLKHEITEDLKDMSNQKFWELLAKVRSHFGPFAILARDICCEIAYTRLNQNF